MHLKLTAAQDDYRITARAWVDQYIVPHADRYDREEFLPRELLQMLAHQGYLGAVVPKEHGGAGRDMISFGLLNEEIGRGCSSVRSLLTVQSMVAYALVKRGSTAQKNRWLPALARGEAIAAFALSEPTAGSDASSIETTAEARSTSYILNGHKKWISFGQIADLFLVFAQVQGKPSAFLVERTRPGVSTIPITGLLGTRASMAAEIHLDRCEVPREHVIGGTGFGLAAIAMTALDLGRYSVAWGSVGIAQACLEASVAYTSTRKQFGVFLKEHQLIRQMITNMLTRVKAARLLCFQAGYLKDADNPSTFMETWIAKYFASTTAMQAAADAVQMHGANGCSSDYAVQRYFRDAKIMEIIEGSTQLQQTMIADYAYQR